MPAEAPIVLGGALNFRDLGGHPASDGRRVKHRRLFRSDHLGGITDADRQLITGLGVRNILDFRSDAERAAFPCPLSEVRNISLAIQTDTHERFQDHQRAGRQLDAETGREVMRDVYRSYIRVHADSFRAFFRLLLEHDGPHLFHCTAGKDRTGMATAMLLTALGVERNVIVEDYLLTNAYWRLKAHHAVGFPDEVRQVLGSADANFLQAAFAVIDEEFGGWDAYARNKLGLGQTERVRLHAWYLEDR